MHIFVVALCVTLFVAFLVFGILLPFTYEQNGKMLFISRNCDRKLVKPMLVLVLLTTFISTYISCIGNEAQAIKDYDPAVVFVDWNKMEIGQRRIGNDVVSYAYHTEKYEYACNNREKLKTTDTSEENNNIIEENDVLYVHAQVQRGFQYTWYIKNQNGKIISEYID